MLAILLAALESEADKQKFTDIYEQYHPQMEQTALRILKNQHDAEDAVQNAFMQIIRHFEKIDEIPCEKLPFWIVCIVKNEAVTILRKNQRTVQLENWDSFAADAESVTDYLELVQPFPGCRRPTGRCWKCGCCWGTPEKKSPDTSRCQSRRSTPGSSADARCFGKSRKRRRFTHDRSGIGYLDAAGSVGFFET